MPELDDKELAELKEILSDSESCARLSQWEEEFLDNFRTRILTYGNDTAVSDKQWQIIHRIQEKVYR